MIDVLDNIIDVLSALITLCSNGVKEGVALVSTYFSSVTAISEFLPSILITAFGCAIAFKVVMRVL